MDEVDRILLNDAQTSGGLLIALDSSRLPELQSRLEQAGAPVTAAVIGKITEGADGVIEVVQHG